MEGKYEIIGRFDTEAQARKAAKDWNAYHTKVTKRKEKGFSIGAGAKVLDRVVWFVWGKRKRSVGIKNGLIMWK